MCRVLFQSFALSFIVIVPCELPAFGPVDIVDTRCDKAHHAPEYLRFRLSF